MRRGTTATTANHAYAHEAKEEEEEKKKKMIAVKGKKKKKRTFLSGLDMG